MLNGYPSLIHKDARIHEAPSGWKLSRIGEACKICNTLRKPLSEQERQSMQGPYPYYGPTSQVDSISEYRVDGTYTLIGEDGDHFLKYGKMSMTQLVSGKYNVNNHAHIIKGTKQCSTEWVFHFFRHRNIYHFLSRQGAGRYKLNKAALSELPILIPPLPEQQKIATVLLTWDRAIDLTEKLIAVKQKRKQALMQQLLATLQNGQRVRFDKVCKVVEGQVDPKESPYCDMPHIGPGNVTKETGELLEVRTAKEDGQTSGKYLFGQQHVLYGKINPHFAKVCFPKCDGVCSADMYPIACDETQIIPQFLYYSLLTHRFTKYATSVSARTGMPKINRSDLNAYHFVLPSISDQSKRCEALNAVTREMELLRQRQRCLVLQKKGLMQQLLTGKVRVNVDSETVKG